MKRYATILVLTVCCLTATSAVYAEAPLADKLPAGSLFYAGWAGRSLPFEGSKLGQLLQEPAVRSLFATLQKSIEKSGEQAAVDAWALAGIAWQHPAAISLMDMEPGRKGPPRISAALLIDLGKDQPAFAKHLDALILASNAPLQAAKVGQVNCRTLPTPFGPVTIGYKGAVFFLTVGDQTAAKLLSVKAATSLKTDKAFIARRKGVAGDNEQAAFSIDLAKLRPLITAIAKGAQGGPKGDGKDKVSQIIDALGLGKITSASGTTRIVDKGLLTRTRILTPAPHRGALMLLAGGTLGDNDLAAAPDDAILCFAAKQSAAAIYAETLAIVKKIDPKVETKIRREIGRAEDELGISFSKDILANLGETWMIASAPSLGGFGSGTVLSVSVKNEAKLNAAIGRLEGVFRKAAAERKQRIQHRHWRRRVPSLEVLKSGKAEIHYIQNIDRDAPFAPAWAVHKGKLYFALWPQVVVAAIENSGKKPLVANAAFKKLRGRFSSKPTTLAYIDTPAIVRNMYNLLLLGWSLGAAEMADELNIEAAPLVGLLPSLSKFEKYLSPEAVAVSSDAEGITIESYGSIPIISNYISSALTTAPVTAAVMIPAISRAQASAKRAGSMANLNGIGKGIAMYQAEDQNGQSPPSLTTLIEKDYLSPWALVSPVSGRRMTTDSKGLPTGKSDYVYLVHGPQTAGSLIRAYELPENYDNKGTIILNVGGAVMWVDMPTFKRMHKKSIAAASGQ